MMTTRRYSELIALSSFEERLEYTRLSSSVGRSTFSFDRYLNQKFYTSLEWKDVRNYVLIRDDACDLGWFDRPVSHKPVIHHMNPITVEDLTSFNSDILDPEFLITVAHNTHNDIHFGAESLVPKVALVREPGDTKLW